MRNSRSGHVASEGAMRFNVLRLSVPSSVLLAAKISLILITEYLIRALIYKGGGSGT